MTDRSQKTDRFEGEVPAALPLSLLEAVRAHDRPDEVLEAENITASLPRRFGLTDVVDTQIRQFEAAQRAGRNIRLDDAVNLIRLMLRRPDAAAVMEDTGRRFAEWHYNRRNAVVRRMYHMMPLRITSAVAARAARRSLRLLHAGKSVSVTRQPFHVRIEGCIAHRIDAGGGACALFTGLLRQQLLQYTGSALVVEHAICTSRDSGRCEWSVVRETASAPTEPRAQLHPDSLDGGAAAGA